MFPTTAWRVPWIHVAFEKYGRRASGIEAGLKSLRKKGKIDSRYVKVVGMGGGRWHNGIIGIQALSGAMWKRGP
jgi:pyruvate ferredoxin oxidoreductase beta subunit